MLSATLNKTLPSSSRAGMIAKAGEDTTPRPGGKNRKSVMVVEDEEAQAPKSGGCCWCVVWRYNVLKLNMTFTVNVSGKDKHLQGRYSHHKCDKTCLLCNISHYIRIDGECKEENIFRMLKVLTVRLTDIVHCRFLDNRMPNIKAQKLITGDLVLR